MATDTDSYAFSFSKSNANEGKTEVISQKIMNRSFHPLLMSLFIAASTAFTCGAEKIDNTHYRFCLMDDAEITDFDLVQADIDNRIPYLMDANWFSDYGVKIEGDKTKVSTRNNVSSINILMLNTYDGTYPSVNHYWYTGYNGVAHEQTTRFYITVQKPSGVSLENIPAKVMIGDEIPFKR